MMKMGNKNGQVSCPLQKEGRLMNRYELPPQVATMANSLYHSLKGQYFVGYADEMFFRNGRNAWAALFNPFNSGVNLFLNVWTVTDDHAPPIRAQTWLNARLPGEAKESTNVTPTNTALCPLPRPRVQLLQASDVEGTPMGGVKAYSRLIAPGETVVAEEDGKFIIPPGGNYAIFLKNAEGTTGDVDTRVGLGWWEQRIC